MYIKKSVSAFLAPILAALAVLTICGALPAAAAEQSSDEVKVRRLEMNATLTVRVGQTRVIPVFFSPSNAKDKSLEWTSSDEEVVAIIGDGTVAAISPGTAVITAETSNGVKAHCTVTVPSKWIKGIILDDDEDIFSLPYEGGGAYLYAYEMRQTVEKAVKRAKDGEVATVTYKNKTRVSAAALRAAEYASQASSAGVSLKFNTTDTKGDILGQLRIDASLARDAQKQINPAVYTSAAKTGAYKNALSGAFDGRVEVINCAETGGYGMLVGIAAKLDLSRMDTSKLYFYCYDPGSGDCRLVENMSYSVDQNGFLHFDIDTGGVIAVSDVLLKR